MSNREQLASLDSFFKPASIAIVGASRTPGKIGYELLRNLKLSGYQGSIYPINPNAHSIQGLECFPELKTIHQQVELALITIPAEMVENVLRQCKEAGVRAVIIITSGFAETGKTELEERLVQFARKEGHFRIVGPNTFGIYCAASKMNSTFGPHHILPGKTAFITQSGALGLALMAWTTDEKYGVSAIVSIGNKADVDDADLLEYFAHDENTRSILIYMEGLKNGKKFFDASKATVKKKPVVIIKAGKSATGARAASSHTGSIAGQDRIYDTAFRQAGILRANSMTQAFDWIQSLNENPMPLGENVVIVTNGGGIGVLAADKSDELGLKLAALSEELKTVLSHVIPSFGSLRNPVDLTANASDETYRAVLKELYRNKEVHGVIALFCETANIDPALVADAMVSIVAEEKEKKPITAAFVGGHLSDVAYRRMMTRGYAAYPTTERAVDGMYALIARYRLLKGEVA